MAWSYPPPFLSVRSTRDMSSVAGSNGGRVCYNDLRANTPPDQLAAALQRLQTACLAVWSYEPSLCHLRYLLLVCSPELLFVLWTEYFVYFQFHSSYFDCHFLTQEHCNVSVVLTLDACVCLSCHHYLQFWQSCRQSALEIWWGVLILVAPLDSIACVAGVVSLEPHRCRTQWLLCIVVF